ncbi:transcription factor GLABRA 3-like [Wolffia australiana]
MAAEQENLKVNVNDLRNGLAAVVHNIQWSYAIFWSPSAGQPGMLEWREGYYNGDIKTRKMTQSHESEDDLTGLHRSEQLRELYVSLSAGDANQLGRRPSSFLSPEDLTDSEWFYLLCMSFTFHPGHGLVGRTLSTGKHIWLTDAHCAEFKVFSRSLLAKSASIRTIFCFTFLDCVVELGTTESVREDTDFLFQVKNFFRDSLNGINEHKSTNDGGAVSQNCILNIPLTPLGSPTLDLEEDIHLGSPPLNLEVHAAFTSGLQALSPFTSYGDDDIKLMTNDKPGEISPADSRDILNKDSSNVSDNQSWNLLDNEPPKQSINNVNEPMECKGVNFSLFDGGVGDLLYERTLAAIFKRSSTPVEIAFVPDPSRSTSFVSWRNDSNALYPRMGSHNQIMLKKILFIQYEDVKLSKFVSVRPWHQRNNQMNKNIEILKSLLPFDVEDKNSILGNTVKYLKELENRVQFLESQMDKQDLKNKELMRTQDDVVERTSDNYEGEGFLSGNKKPSTNKRKAREADINVSVMGNEVIIQVSCPWRDCLLLEVMDAANSINLDAHYVQSSTVEGNLIMTIKSKFKGSAVASPGLIKGRIHRAVCKC